MPELALVLVDMGVSTTGEKYDSMFRSLPGDAAACCNSRVRSDNIGCCMDPDGRRGGCCLTEWTD